jgi:hypothetical protein
MWLCNYPLVHITCHVAVSFFFFYEFHVHFVIKKLIMYPCGIQRFIGSHPWTSAVHSFMPRVIFLLCLVLPSCFFPLRFSNLAVVWIPYPLYTTYYVHLILLGLISLPAIRSVCNFCCPVFFFFFKTCSLQHVFSNIFSIFFFLQSERPGWHPY